MEDSSPRGHRRGRRQWTDFEMKAVLALLCKGEHRGSGGALHFSYSLNKALNIFIDADDVGELLNWIEDEKPHALRFIELQRPQRLTRAAVAVFNRTDLNYTGTKEEWEFDGRRERVARMNSSPRRMRMWADAITRQKQRRIEEESQRQAEMFGGINICMRTGNDFNFEMTKEGEEEGEILDSNARLPKDRDQDSVDAVRTHPSHTAHRSMPTSTHLPPRPQSPARNHNKPNGHGSKTSGTRNPRLQNLSSSASRPESIGGLVASTHVSAASDRHVASSRGDKAMAGGEHSVLSPQSVNQSLSKTGTPSPWHNGSARLDESQPQKYAGVRPGSVPNVGKENWSQTSQRHHSLAPVGGFAGSNGMSTGGLGMGYNSRVNLASDTTGHNETGSSNANHTMANSGGHNGLHPDRIRLLDDNSNRS